MAVTDPDRYLDPAKYEAYIAAFLQGGNTEEEARLNLKRTGFNLPGEETVTETMTDTAITEPGTTGAGPELEQWKSLMDPDLPMPTEQGFQQAGTEVEESLTEVEGMRPIQEYAQGLMDKNPLPGAADERPLFQRLMTAGARQNLKPIPSKKVEPEPETEVEEAALVQEELKPKDEDKKPKPGTEPETEPDAYQISLWKDEVGEAITNPTKKTIYDEIWEFADQMAVPEISQEGGFRFFGNKKDDYVLVRDKINEDIDKYETSIQDIAQEKQKPPLEGSNMWLAILGVALGAAGSALTRTPNEAMQMLEGFLDREQQKFLKSKEMKMRSADQQRLDLIRRRGELLQQFQNETSRVLQISQFQLQKTTAKANIQRIQDQLQMAADQNRDNLNLQIAKILKDLVVSGNTLQASMGKSERERYVPSLELTDQDGNKVMYGGFAARSAKAAGALWDYYSIMRNAEAIINDLEPLLERSVIEKLSPAAFSQTRTEILAHTAELEKEFKNLAGFGANYAEREILLNKATLPSIMDDSTMNLLIGAKRAIAPFRKKINRAYRSKIAPHGGTSINLPGQQSETGKTYGGKRYQKE